MLRDEVEALLKIEGLQITLKVKRWKNGSWRYPTNESWMAILNVPTLGLYKVENARTNHKAASYMYMHYLEEKEKHANN